MLRRLVFEASSGLSFPCARREAAGGASCPAVEVPGLVLRFSFCELANSRLTGSPCGGNFGAAAAFDSIYAGAAVDVRCTNTRGVGPLLRSRGIAVFTVFFAGVSKPGPIERCGSIVTHRQCRRNCCSCSLSSSRNPCNRNGVSIHGRSRSATNIPSFKSSVLTFWCMVCSR